MVKTIRQLHNRHTTDIAINALKAHLKKTAKLIFEVNL